MSKIETGGPAFPLHNHGAQTLGLHITGMTLRDYFAAKAMPAIYPSDYDYKTTALMAYEMADAMMEARK